jgi:hypothetical protein
VNDWVYHTLQCYTSRSPGINKISGHQTCIDHPLLCIQVHAEGDAYFNARNNTPPPNHTKGRGLDEMSYTYHNHKESHAIGF